MKKRNAVILSAALGISASFCTYAADFGHEQTLTISGKPAYLAETSARVLANQNATVPELVEDITDGFGAKKIPGYKLMVMGRTYSMAAETKPPKQGQTQWRENAYVHRGIKLYLGIPVAGGKMDLANAKLINIGVVDDDGGSAPHVPEEKIRPVGKQLMGKDTKIEKAKLRISELDFPDMDKGETSGGGVRLEAEAVIDGKPVHTKINSTFARFYTGKPASAGAFKADARLMK